MKKLFALLVLAGLIVSTTGCGGGTTSKATTPAPAGDKMKDDKMKDEKKP